jgi:hypothetical protein
LILIHALACCFIRRYKSVYNWITDHAYRRCISALQDRSRIFVNVLLRLYKVRAKS